MDTNQDGMRPDETASGLDPRGEAARRLAADADAARKALDEARATYERMARSAPSILAPASGDDRAVTQAIAIDRIEQLPAASPDADPDGVADADPDGVADELEPPDQPPAGQEPDQSPGVALDGEPAGAADLPPGTVATESEPPAPHLPPPDDWKLALMPQPVVPHDGAITPSAATIPVPPPAATVSAPPPAALAPDLVRPTPPGPLGRRFLADAPTGAMPGLVSVGASAPGATALADPPQAPAVPANLTGPRPPSIFKTPIGSTPPTDSAALAALGPAAVTVPMAEVAAAVPVPDSASSLDFFPDDSEIGPLTGEFTSADSDPNDPEAAGKAARAEASRRKRSRIKWWLPLQQLLAPGYAQRKAGNRVLGLIGMVGTVLWWGGLIGLVVGLLVRRHALLQLLARPATLAVLVAAFVILGAICLVCGISSIALAERGRAKPSKVIAGILVGAVMVGQCLALGGCAVAVNSARELISTVFSAAPAASDSSGAAANGVAGGGAVPAGQALTDGRVNILMLGGDAGKGRWGLRPDSISVMSIDANSGASVIVGIPRNLENVPFAKNSPLWGPYPHGYDCGDECLINALYTYATGHPDLYSAPQYAGQDPGVLATKDAVEGVTGLTIDYTVLIDMSGFADMVDAAGGVTVDVPKDTLAQDRKTVFKQGTQHMTGAQALLYARTRYDADDFGRMAKQRLLEEALLEQADPMRLLASFSNLSRAGSRYVKTDIPQDDLVSLIEVAAKAKEKGTTSLELVPPTVNVVHPDIDAIHQMVSDAIAAGK